jgi:hypothetical protein
MYSKAAGTGHPSHGIENYAVQIDCPAMLRMRSFGFKHIFLADSPIRKLEVGGKRLEREFLVKQENNHWNWFIQLPI